VLKKTHTHALHIVRVAA